MKNNRIDELAIASIRSLCIDEINKPKSGHPGMALGAAPAMYTLYKYHLVSDPKHPTWINRDRFILSSGHASGLLYVMLHVCGYQVSMNDIKAFRTINSLTTGHPEFGHTPGVDNTSGPLGQGLSQAVGVAMAEAHIAATYPVGKSLMNHYTYCMLGDGDLEEGISQEAISLAGLQKLNKLICLYDSNGITLDGKLSLSFNDNTKARFLASHWNVLNVKDGNDVNEINQAISKAKLSKDKPTLIIVNTIIGYGSKNQGTNKVHGAPLGVEDGAYAKKSYHYNFPEFTVPKEVYKTLRDSFIARGEKAYKKYQSVLTQYKQKHPKDYQIFNDAFNLNVKKYIKDNVVYDPKLNEASRKTSGNLVNKFASEIPFMLGGAADVAGSVMTKIATDSEFSPKNRKGRNISFGIREFEMAGVQNGMLLHGGLRPYVGCFLVFADYMKNAIRMSALSKLPAIYLFSHDSIYLGEDGPTHQPVEQVAMLRSIPNLHVYRPADARETYGAWKLALTSKTTPSAIILSRQNLPLLKGSSDIKVSQGAYIIAKEKSKKFVTVIATGSEVNLAIQAKELLNNKIDVRVVSMPSMERFNALDEKTQLAILGAPYEKRIALEALTTFGWHRYAKHVIGVDQYGLSGKGDEVAKVFGITIDHLVEVIKKVGK
ncbi:MAG: transketolase [Bacilli bacterium]|nr:transketolase [Bacilli bacterium]